MKTRDPLLFLFALSLSPALGCAKPSAYVVTPTSREAVPEKLDGHWFRREINDVEGLKYVELVYCPLQPGDPAPVCRTAIVWTRGRSRLIPK